MIDHIEYQNLNMKFYKKLDLDHDLWSDIHRQMTQIIIEDYGIPGEIDVDRVYGCINNDLFLERVPAFKIFMSENRIEKLWIACVALTKNVRAHVDFSRGCSSYQEFQNKSLDRRLAINWPIYNVAQSETAYYETLENDAAVIRDNLLINFEENKLRKIDSFTLTEPTMLRADLIHGMKVFNDKTRIIFSTRFQQDPIHLF